MAAPALAPRLLNARIRDAPGLAQLLELFSAHVSIMDHMHLANLCHKLGKHLERLPEQQRIEWLSIYSARISEVLGALRGRLGEFGPQELSNTLSGLAKLNARLEDCEGLSEELSKQASSTPCPTLPHPTPPYPTLPHPTPPYPTLPQVRTLAGVDAPGTADGNGAAARFILPQSVSLDAEEVGKQRIDIT